MKKILILYHSDVGNTKKISEQIYLCLEKTFQVELCSVEKIPNELVKIYDEFVIGFPVIHTHPTKRILNFIDSITSFTEPKPTYVFTTCGLYSANTLRIFAKHCINKNLIPVLHRVFWGCPANALKKDEMDYPIFISKKCEKCYRCIHHCPRKALSLNKRRVPKKVLE